MAGFGKLVMAALAVSLVPYEVRKKEDGSFSYKSLLLNVESGKDEAGEKKLMRKKEEEAKKKAEAKAAAEHEAAVRREFLDDVSVQADVLTEIRDIMLRMEKAANDKKQGDI